MLPNSRRLEPKDYGSLRTADPRSIFVVPAVNQSVYVNAPDYYLTTITRPLAERGYYVLPVPLVNRVLEEDGLSDADMVHHGNPRRLGEMFGADAILHVMIERWDARYPVISTTTTVKSKYRLVDVRSGKALWHNELELAYAPQSNSGGTVGLIVQAMASAIEKADPNYMPLARQLNVIATGVPHQGLPAGPHDGLHQKDADNF